MTQGDTDPAGYPSLSAADSGIYPPVTKAGVCGRCGNAARKGTTLCRLCAGLPRRKKNKRRNKTRGIGIHTRIPTPEPLPAVLTAEQVAERQRRIDRARANDPDYPPAPKPPRKEVPPAELPILRLDNPS